MERGHGGRGAIGSAVLLAVVALLVLRPWEPEPRALPSRVRAEVVRVVDGDTFEARIGGDVEDVRLIGVDTPETVKPDTPVQCFGPRASRFTHSQLEGRGLRLLLGRERRDVYGRLLAYAWLGPRFFNAELLRRGLARTLTIPPNDRFAGRFAAIQHRAALAGRGLWAACAP